MFHYNYSSQILKPSYYYYDFWEQHGDSLVSEFPLMKGGPWKVIVICLSYWLLVCFIGPFVMKNRQPFDLRIAILLHDSFLIAFNGIGFISAFYMTNFFIDTWDCQATISSNVLTKTTMAYLGYLYFISKILDFGDTFFFILRKRFNQASFLHVFHHGIMPLIGYIGLKFHLSSYTAFLPSINIFIHAIMYSYYALSCVDQEMKKYLWWKKYLTQLQLVQFVLLILHSLYALVNSSCKWPVCLCILQGLHAIFFFFLFFTFYRKSYSVENGEKR